MHFIPHSDLRFLQQAYNGSDVFVSLSLYHDEDFGYSPLEALSCGTPVVCTNWGGYRDFKKSLDKSHSVELIDVSLEENFLIVDNSATEKKLLKSLKNSNHSKRPRKFIWTRILYQNYFVPL